MTKERVVIIIIAIIILGALFNALIKANILEFSGSKLHEKDRLAEVKADLEEIKDYEVTGDKRYNKKEMFDILKKIGFKITSDSSVTSAISPEGKGDISVSITGETEIDTLRIQARNRDTKKDHDAINQLYFKKIYKLTGLPEAWLKDSMASLDKMGTSESYSIDGTVDGNILSLGYNRALASYVFDADFTN